MIERAKCYYHGDEGYNCAQAVLAAADVSDADIAEAQAYGGGRAPDGECGALYAARLLMAEADFTAIHEKFEAEASGTLCSIVRPLANMSCREYVGFVAGLIETKRPAHSEEQP